MRKDITRQVANVVALLVTIGINGLANALPLNGQTTGAISDRFPVYFVPAGYVFAIWGLIYLGLLGFAVYQALPAQRANPRLRRIGSLFVLSCIANSVWIFLWHYNQFPLTLVAILALLLTLLAIYLRLDIGRASVAPAERWLVHIPFSIYLGWATVATIANATVALYDQGWGGLGISGPVWAALLIAVAGLIGAALRILRRDTAYALVIVWALVGILVKQSATPIVAVAAGAAALVVAALLLAGLLGALPRGRQLAGPA